MAGNNKGLTTRRSIAALGITAPLALAFAGLYQSLNLESATPSGSKLTKIMASDLTRKNLPIINQFEKLAQGSVDEIHIVTCDDFTEGPIAEGVRLRKAYLVTGANADKNPFMNFVYNSEYVAAATEQMREHLFKIAPHILERMHELELHYFTLDIIDATGNAPGVIDIEGRRCSLIGAPWSGLSKKSAAAFIARLPVGFVENLPGTDSDWRDAIALHELSHALKPLHMEIIPNENESDGDMRMWYGWLRDRSRAPGVPRALMNMRAIRTALDPDKSDPHNFSAVAEGMESQKAALNAPQSDLVKGLEYFEDVTSVAAGHLTIEDRAWRLEQPSSVYWATVKAYKSGAFRENHLALRFAENFIRAANNYAPTYFQISSAPAPAPKPSSL